MIYTTRDTITLQSMPKEGLLEFVGDEISIERDNDRKGRV